MGNSIAKLFGIEKEETGVITTLLTQSVFLGIFYGVFNITAHSLFLAKFDETVMAKAYIISGLVGVGLTYLYTLLQSRLKFTGFSVINLGFITSITTILWILLKIYPENWVIFVFFIMLGPLNLLTLLGFYGTTGRLFTLRQGKRLFGIIDTGLVVGVIISSFSIPGLLSLNIETHDILLISSGSLLAALAIQLLISKNHKETILNSSSKEVKSDGPSVFRTDSYIRMMGLFIALSVVVMFFVQYSFMAVTKARFPEEQEMASFLGLFEGSMMVFTLIIKTFLFSYLIKNHGLKVTLAVGPILIAIFVLIATILGFTSGFETGAAGFLLFFLILAISRLFSKAMKDSVETPAFKVLYQTLSDKVRFRVQSAIDGTINEVAALASGLLLTGLGALAFVKLIHFSVVLLGVVVLWIFVGLKLYNEYRNSVKRSLDSVDEGDISLDTLAGHRSAIIDGLRFTNDFYSLVDNSIDVAGEEDSFTRLILRYSERSLDPLMIPLLKKILSTDPTSLSGEAEILIDKITSGYPFKDVSKVDLITNLEIAEDKRGLVKSYSGSGGELLLTDLLRLIRDNDVEIKRQAIFMIGKQQVIEMIPDLCDCLSIPEVRTDAYSVIKSFGEKSFDALAATFFRSSGSSIVRILIVRLFGESGSAEAASFLLARLWEVHKEIRQEALTGLLNCKYTPDDEGKDRLIQEVQVIIGLLTWYISSTVSLKGNDDKVLAGVLIEESAWWHRFLFDLLALIYDKHSIDKIRENLDVGTVESVNFALEMLDIVADDSIKPRLAALLDVVSDDERLKTLLQFYPGTIPDYNELVEDLINLDYNHVSVWTKSCAIRSLYKIETAEDKETIIALLFSPNMILREEAVRYLREKHRDVYDYCAYRVPEGFKGHLSEVLSKTISERDEIYQKVLTLNRFFPEIQPDMLINMGMSLQKIDDLSGFNINEDDEIVLFYIPEGNNGAKQIYVRWNLIDIDNLTGITELANTQELYVLSIDTLAEELFINPALTKTVIGAIEMNLNTNE